MGGRTRLNWGYFVGGPFDGQRHILNQKSAQGTIHMHTPAPTPGMCCVHEYLFTGEWRRNDRDGGMKRAPARVAQFVRTLADEPIPPRPPEYLQPMEGWFRQGPQ